MNTKLAKIIRKFRNKKIIVIGDIMLDHFVRGSVSRISPEAPVPVVLVKEENFLAGGAGNVSVNITSLDAKSVLVSVVGEDMFGSTLKKFLSNSKVNTTHLLEDKTRPTTKKTRIIAEHQQVVRFDRESKTRINQKLSHKCMEHFKKVAKDADGVIISDYGKGMLSNESIKEIIKICNRHKLPVCVDPKTENFKKYKNVTCITPNSKEAWEGMSMIPKEGEEEIDELGEKILKTLKAQSILITRGPNGMSLFEKGKKQARIKATAKEVYDVTGAGDSVISVLTLALASGASVKDAAKIANYAGGIVVGKLGTATVSQEELLEALK